MSSGTVLVTGGAGYIGIRLVETLLKRTDKQVVVLDNFSRGRYNFLGPLKLKYPARIEIVPADIRDAHDIGKALAKHRPEEVIHLAAIVDAFSTNREGKDIECTRVNKDATIQLAELSKKHGVKAFIHTSSVSIYSQGENLTEDSPKQPLSAYGRAKLESEEILKLNDENFKVTALRPATIVGWSPAFATQTIINLACARAAYNTPLTVFDSALENNKSYLHIQDYVNAILFCLKNINKAAGNAYNTVSFHTNLKTVLDTIKKELGREFPIELVKTSGISQQVYTVSGEKFNSLGFKPKGTLEQAIKETLKNLPVKHAFKKATG